MGHPMVTPGEAEGGRMEPGSQSPRPGGLRSQERKGGPIGRVCRQERENVNRNEKGAQDPKGEEWGRKALPALMNRGSQGQEETPEKQDLGSREERGVVSFQCRGWVSGAAVLAKRSPGGLASSSSQELCTQGPQLGETLPDWAVTFSCISTVLLPW